MTREIAEQPICERCGCPMIAKAAKAASGVKTVTARCVGCGHEREISGRAGGDACR